MKLKAKILYITTKGPLIVIVHHRDADKIDLEHLGRIRIRKGSKEVVVAADFSHGTKGIREGEIGIFLDVADELRIKNNELVEISLEPKPESLAYIKKKLDKQELKKHEIDSIIKDLLANKLTEVETTYFVSACYVNGMTLEESAYLAEAIVNNSGKLKFDSKKIIVDKHSIGGIPANRTTPVIVPILAAAGLTVPKTSTRSITSPSGTADTFEVLAPVSHSKEKIMKIIKKTNACMVWGGTLDLASADDKLIQLEKVLSLDPEGFLLASILAKKSSVDSSHILIDIPIGPEAKIKTEEKAKDLAKKFIILGKKLKMKIEVIITDGSQPIGNGIGPALEARDVLLVLQNNGPEDLKKKSVYMAGLILEMAGYKNSYKTALKILESGKAYEKMKEIIKAQGGNPNIKPDNIKLGRHVFSYKSRSKGRVRYISNILVTKLAKIAGAPADKGAGVYLHKKVGDRVEKNKPLFTIYAESRERLNFALKENLKKVMKY